MWMWTLWLVQLRGCLQGLSLSDVRLFHPVILPSHAHTRHIDGAARIGSTLSSELLNAIFAKVGQAAIRKVARETFEHLLNLDLRFHLSRQTGGLTRAIDRGTKYVRAFCAGYGSADKEMR